MNILKDHPHASLADVGISESEYLDACAAFGIRAPKLVSVERMDTGWLDFLEWPEEGGSFFIRNVRLTVRSLEPWEVRGRSDVQADLQGLACL